MTSRWYTHTGPTEPGVASNLNAGPVNLTGSFQSIASRSITVPAAGFVLVVASMEVEVNHESGGFSFTISGISEDGSTLPSNQDHSFHLPSGAAPGSYLAPEGDTALFTVGAGTHTYHIFSRFSGGGSGRAWDAQLNLVYFPRSYGTVVSTREAPASPRGEGASPLSANP